MTGEIGTVTMYPKLERREWIFTPAPDPRDARIAELEAALREIRDDLGAYVTPMKSEARTVRRIDAVLPRPPEGDMAITSEELDA